MRKTEKTHTRLESERGKMCLTPEFVVDIALEGTRAAMRYASSSSTFRDPYTTLKLSAGFKNTAILIHLSIPRRQLSRIVRAGLLFQNIIHHFTQPLDHINLFLISQLLTNPSPRNKFPIRPRNLSRILMSRRSRRLFPWSWLSI